MKATHILHGKYPVRVEENIEHPELAWVTYVGPTVPGNRRVGQRVAASRKNFDGQPTLTPIS